MISWCSEFKEGNNYKGSADVIMMLAGYAVF